MYLMQAGHGGDIKYTELTHMDDWADSASDASADEETLQSRLDDLLGDDDDDDNDIGQVLSSHAGGTNDDSGDFSRNRSMSRTGSAPGNSAAGNSEMEMQKHKPDPTGFDIEIDITKNS